MIIHRECVLIEIFKSLNSWNSLGESVYVLYTGTSVNVQDYYGRTPLHMAAYRGLSDIMFLLLENRGDVNARDFEVGTYKLFGTYLQNIYYEKPDEATPYQIKYGHMAFTIVIEKAQQHTGTDIAEVI